MKKKAIISGMHISLVLLCYLIFNVIIFFVSNKYVFIKDCITISSDVVNTITSYQINISLISITIMIFFLGSVEERIMGISYKKIFFNGTFFYCFNITNCIFLMLIFMTVSIFSSCVLLNTKFDIICFISKITCGTALIFSIIFLFYMAYLGMILKYKQSRVYCKIFEELEKANEDIYKEIVKHLDMLNDKKEYRQYIREEFIILAYILLNIDNFVDNTCNKRVVMEKIISTIHMIIKYDYRNNYDILVILYNEAKEVFGKEDANYIFCG